MTKMVVVKESSVCRLCRGRLEAAAGDRQGWCRRDVLRQTAPDASCGDRKRSVGDGWQLRTTDNQRRWRGGTKATSSHEVRRLSTFIGNVRGAARISMRSLAVKERNFEISSLLCLPSSAVDAKYPKVYFNGAPSP